MSKFLCKSISKFPFSQSYHKTCNNTNEWTNFLSSRENFANLGHKAFVKEQFQQQLFLTMSLLTLIFLG